LRRKLIARLRVPLPAALSAFSQKAPQAMEHAPAQPNDATATPNTPSQRDSEEEI
jgi:hypothetical protein